MRNVFATSAILAVLLAPSMLSVSPAQAEGAPITPPAATPPPVPTPEKPDLRKCLEPRADTAKVKAIQKKIDKVDAHIERLKGHIDDKQEQLNKLPAGTSEAQKLQHDIELNRREMDREQEERRGLEAERLSAEGKTMGSMMGC